MPISWKCTVQQYTGLLHPLFDGKDEVQIYDYVDVHEPMLEKMYQRRLKGYASIGYSAKSEIESIEEIHPILNSLTFVPVRHMYTVATPRRTYVFLLCTPKQKASHFCEAFIIYCKLPNNYGVTNHFNCETESFGNEA